jgi:hypothetical protein
VGAFTVSCTALPLPSTSPSSSSFFFLRVLRGFVVFSSGFDICRLRPDTVGVGWIASPLRVVDLPDRVLGAIVGADVDMRCGMWEWEWRGKNERATMWQRLGLTGRVVISLF